MNRSRRFAADFRDNPAGDFLLSLDLQDEVGGPQLQPGGGSDPASRSSTIATGSSAGGGAAPAAAPPTLLELALSLLLSTASCGAPAAALLHRRGLLGLCQELCAYSSPAVVTAAQRLYAAVADRCGLAGGVAAGKVQLLYSCR